MNRTFKKSFNLLKIKTNFVDQLCYYSRNSKNIIRNRYWYRNADGSYKEYNESITVLPDEFKDQDEYKSEKRINQMYVERYKKHLESKQKMYSMQLPKTNAENTDEINYCQHKQTNDDMPQKLDSDPFKKEQHQCIFCKHNIPIDYKNVQLLSQFVSPYTGIIYSQQVTGLCHFKYEELQNNIIKARRLGLMPFFYKETVFQKDPQLFNPNYNSLKEIPNNFDKRKLNSDDI